MQQNISMQRIKLERKKTGGSCWSYVLIAVIFFVCCGGGFYLGYQSIYKNSVMIPKILPEQEKGLDSAELSEEKNAYADFGNHPFHGEYGGLYRPIILPTEAQLNWEKCYRKKGNFLGNKTNLYFLCQNKTDTPNTGQWFLQKIGTRTESDPKFFTFSKRGDEGPIIHNAAFFARGGAYAYYDPNFSKKYDADIKELHP